MGAASNRKQPGNDVGETLSRIYVDWSLFPSSYVPLFLIFAIRMWPKHLGYAVGACTFGAIFAMNLFRLLNVRTAPRDFSIKRSEGGGSEIAAYIATYILPFLVVSDVGPADLVAYGALIFIIGLVMTREEVLHINPLLAVMGLHLSTIITEDEERYYVISGDRLFPKTILRAIAVRPRLLYER